MVLTHTVLYLHTRSVVWITEWLHWLHSLCWYQRLIVQNNQRLVSLLFPPHFLTPEWGNNSETGCFIQLATTTIVNHAPMITTLLISVSLFLQCACMYIEWHYNHATIVLWAQQHFTRQVEITLTVINNPSRHRGPLKISALVQHTYSHTSQRLLCHHILFVWRWCNSCIRCEYHDSSVVNVSVSCKFPFLLTSALLLLQAIPVMHEVIVK